jgi:hypothetical protein
MTSIVNVFLKPLRASSILLMRSGINLLMLLCFALNSGTVFSQRLVRSSLNSFGMSIAESGVTLCQTAGQDALVSCFSTEGYSLHQGFQQSALSSKAVAGIYTLNALPNPHHGSFSIAHNFSDSQVFSIQVFNAAGLKVPFTMFSQNSVLQINLSDSAVPGFYLIIVQANSGTYVVKSVCIP